MSWWQGQWLLIFYDMHIIRKLAASGRIEQLRCVVGYQELALVPVGNRTEQVQGLKRAEQR